MSDEITDALFARQWYKHTDQLFYPGPCKPEPFASDLISSLQSFLRILQETADAYLKRRSAGPPNYEHLFSLAKTVKDDLSAGQLNPAVGDFVENICRQTESIWKSFNDRTWSGTRCDQLASLAHHSQIFIESVVRHELMNKNPVGFNALLALLCDLNGFEHIDLVTLNHDLLLESLLAAIKPKGISFCDGFTHKDGDVRFYEDRAFAGDDRIRLLKPHGSIDWYLFRRLSDEPSADRYGIPDPKVDPWHARDSDGKWYDNLSGNPTFLTGINKAPRYATGFFGMQMSWFRRFLEQTQRIMCSGYGWRDDGMNDLLVDWLFSSPDHRLILLHDGKRIEADLLKNPFSPWSYRFRDALKTNRLRIIPKWLCCCRDEADIKEQLS